MRVDVSEAIALYADGLMLPIEPACQHWPLVRRGIRPMSLHDTKPYIAWNVEPLTWSQVDRYPGPGRARQLTDAQRSRCLNGTQQQDAKSCRKGIGGFKRSTQQERSDLFDRLLEG